MKKTFLFVLLLGGIALLGLGPVQAQPSHEPVQAQPSHEPVQTQSPVLHFSQNGTFKIVQFTDLHFDPARSESLHGVACIEAVLNAEHPDFVIFTGDSFWGSPAREAMNTLLAPVLKRHIPYAFCWGNHDDEQDMSRAQIQQMVEAQPNNCGFTVPDVSGFSNFALPIYDSDAYVGGIVTSSAKPVFVLYCFDSKA